LTLVFGVCLLVSACKGAETEDDPPDGRYTGLTVYKSNHAAISVTPSADIAVTEADDAFTVTAADGGSLVNKSVTVRAVPSGEAAQDGTLYFFRHWSNDAAATANPYTFTFNGTFKDLRASMMAALSHERIQQIVGAALAALNNQDYAIGNPAENTGAAVEIAALAGELNTLLIGETHVRQIALDGGGTEDETYTVYDEDSLTGKAAELEGLLAANPGLTIIVPEMVFAYSGAVKTAKLHTTGSYEIELTGGAGGHTWTNTNNVAPGGKGGHVFGKKSFPANTDVTVRVGGQGAGTATYNQGTAQYQKIADGFASTHLGGWNGGGIGGAGVSPWTAGSGGGGATDIRAGGDAVANRIFVAAGGGGAAQANAPGNYGVRGGNALGVPDAENPRDASEGIAVWGDYYPADNPQPGTSATENGVDGRSSTSSDGGEGRGGGGGGKNGGGAVTSTTRRGSGAGGANYIGDGFTETVNSVVSGNQWGNGTARIRWLN
jgi:hypothetical protein